MKKKGGDVHIARNAWKTYKTWQYNTNHLFDSSGPLYTRLWTMVGFLTDRHHVSYRFRVRYKTNDPGEGAESRGGGGLNSGMAVHASSVRPNSVDTPPACIMNIRRIVQELLVQVIHTVE